MMAEQKQIKRRLNPFAFPAETDVRFVLLVVAALAISFTLGSFLDQVLDVYGVGPELPGVTGTDSFRIQDLIIQARTQAIQAIALIVLPIILTLIVFCVAYIIYRTYPRRIRRQYKLRFMTEDEDRLLFASVRTLSETVGITPAPLIEMNTEQNVILGQAFGFRKRFSLLLGGLCRLQLRKVPNRFRALVLHEMGHMANRDIGRSYFAQALWISAATLTILPMIVYSVYALFISRLITILQGGFADLDLVRWITVSLPTILFINLKVWLLILLIAAIRASILRIRETYADWRVAMWGEELTLQEILAEQTPSSKLHGLRRLFQLHPSPQERLALLIDPSHLYKVSYDLPLVAGILMAMIFVALVGIFPVVAVTMISTFQILWLWLIQLLGLGSSNNDIVVRVLTAMSDLGLVMSYAIGLIGFVFLAYLIAGSVGIAVQRESVADTATGRRGIGGYIRLLPVAALLAIGLEGGFILVPGSIMAPFEAISFLEVERVLNLVLAVFVFIPTWLIVVTGLSWLWLAFVRFFAKRLFRTHTGSSPPVGKRRLLSLITTGLVFVLYLPAVIGQYVLSGYISGLEKMTMTPQWVSTLSVALIVALSIYVFVFGAMWLLLAVRRTRQDCQCSKCEYHARFLSLDALCPRCGERLAAWLFAAETPQAKSRISA